MDDGTVSFIVENYYRALHKEKIYTDSIRYNFDENLLKISSDEVKDLHDILFKIIPDNPTLDYLLMKIGRAILGLDIKKDPEIIYIYGNGGSGKSTLMKFIRESCDGIYQQISPLAFDDKREFAKVINGMKNHTRILHLDEPSMAFKMTNALKTFANGTVIHSKLYKEGNYETDINAKLFITANNIMKFDSIKSDEGDSGVRRRIIFLKLKSQFVKPSKLPTDGNGIPIPDVNKHIYPVDDRYSDAYPLDLKLKSKFLAVCILLSQRNLSRPPAFKTLEQILDLNVFCDKVLDKLEGGKISKIYMFKLLEVFMPFSNINTAKGWVTEFEKIGILYNENEKPYAEDTRVKGIKGCFLNVCLKHSMQYVLDLPKNTTIDLYDDDNVPLVSSGFSIASEMSL
jgi:energy-coupling factor transporter ATP-binding protein EcfA2